MFLINYTVGFADFQLVAVIRALLFYNSINSYSSLPIFISFIYSI